MAIMEDEDVNVGEGSGDAEQHYLQVAYVLQDRLRDVRAGTGDGASALTEILEIATEEFGFEREDQGKSMKRRKESREKLSMASERVKRRCNHSCSDHNEPMNPKLWKILPRELLQLVFARLPVDQICRLQFLSKDWQRTITADSGFNRVFSEVSPKIVCLITRNHYNLFWVRVLDLSCSKWHAYKIVAGRPAVDWTAIPRPMMTVELEFVFK